MTTAQQQSHCVQACLTLGEVCRLKNCVIHLTDLEQQGLGVEVVLLRLLNLQGNPLWSHLHTQHIDCFGVVMMLQLSSQNTGQQLHVLLLDWNHVKQQAA